MKSEILRLNNISFSYDSQSKILFKSVTLNIHKGWTGIIGPNGSGKTTFLKLCLNRLQIHEGNLVYPDNCVYCEQRTDDYPENADEFIYSYDKNAVILKSILKINEEFLKRWNTLSHGERKRLQIGNALYREPDLIAIDEPTNHLDREAKEFILNALIKYKGIGLIVSHNREFLNSLCTQCIFIESPDILLYSGNYKETKTQYDQNIQYNKKMYKKLDKEKKRISSIINDRKKLAQNADKRVSKKSINKKDHDSKAKIDAARLTGKDAVGGKLVNQVKSRLSNTVEKQKQYKIKKEYDTGINFNTDVSKRKNIFYKESDEIKLGPDKKLIINNISINPSDKIGLTGINGSGKSTLVKYILENINLKQEYMLFIPQEIDINATKVIQKNIHELNDENLGRMMALITRLGSDPKRLLESKLYSPGETRKLLFAYGVINNPQIIIMDEPTNHLDIISIECLETALKDIQSALLLVSHDFDFLRNLVDINWKIIKEDNNYTIKKTGFDY